MRSLATFGSAPLPSAPTWPQNGSLDSATAQRLSVANCKQSSFRTWAYRVAWNAAQMFWRDPFRRRVRRLATAEYSMVAEQLRVSSLRPDPLAAADRLAKLRESLQPDEQTLLILRVDKGLSLKEIALVLAESEEAPSHVSALRKRFERLKNRLVEMAEKEGLLQSRRH